MTGARGEILPEAKDLLGVIDAARRLGISHWTLRKHIARKNVEATRIGNRVLIRPAEIARVARMGLPPLTNETESDTGNA